MHDPIPSQRRRGADRGMFAAAMTAGVIVQAGALAGPSLPGGCAPVEAFAVAMLPAALCLLPGPWLPPHGRCAGLAVATIGGAGMAAGHAFVAYRLGTWAEICVVGAPVRLPQALGTAVMFAACLAACALARVACRTTSPPRREAAQVVELLSMWLGMQIAGRLLSPGAATMFHPVAAMHLAMTIGMMSAAVALHAGAAQKFIRELDHQIARRRPGRWLRTRREASWRAG